MHFRTIASAIAFGMVFWAGSALAYDCTGLPE